ncbi:MAG: hypothetical protein ACRD9R_21270, partial [Pyrinomonadaceae bacterium]
AVVAKEAAKQLRRGFEILVKMSGEKDQAREIERALARGGLLPRRAPAELRRATPQVNWQQVEKLLRVKMKPHAASRPAAPTRVRQPEVSRFSGVRVVRHDGETVAPFTFESLLPAPEPVWPAAPVEASAGASLLDCSDNSRR